jgi:hypothetical protein
MSTVPETPPPAPPRLPPPAQRSGCLTAIMVVAGLIMLLPGLCAIIFGVGSLTGSSIDPTVLTLVVIGLAVGDPQKPGVAPNSANQMSNNPLFFGVF